MKNQCVHLNFLILYTTNTKSNESHAENLMNSHGFSFDMCWCSLLGGEIVPWIQTLWRGLLIRTWHKCRWHVYNMNWTLACLLDAINPINKSLQIKVYDNIHSPELRFGHRRGWVPLYTNHHLWVSVVLRSAIQRI